MEYANRAHLSERTLSSAVIDLELWVDPLRCRSRRVKMADAKLSPISDSSDQLAITAYRSDQ